MARDRSTGLALRHTTSGSQPTKVKESCPISLDHPIDLECLVIFVWVTLLEGSWVVLVSSQLLGLCLSPYP